MKKIDTKCLLCTSPFSFEKMGPGRLRRYCSDPCRKAAQGAQAKARYEGGRAESTAKTRAWQIKNRVRYLGMLSRWRTRNPGYNATWKAKRPGYSRLAYARNRDHIASQAHARYMANPLRRQVRTGPYLSQHPEGKRISTKLYRQRHPEKIAAKLRARAARYGSNTSRSRARFFGVAYELIDRVEVFCRDGWKCWLCQKPTPRAAMGSHRQDAPEIDHVVPVSKGGPHTYENVRGACRACNMAKGSTMPIDFVRRPIDAARRAGTLPPLAAWMALVTLETGRNWSR